MIATIDIRRVRQLRLEHAKLRARWRIAPALTWAFLVNALILAQLALHSARKLDPQSPRFFADMHAFDVLIAIAIVLFLGAVAAWLSHRKGAHHGK